MGRLFWKFFLSILLAQLAATFAIGSAVWLKNRDADKVKRPDIDTSPPAELAIEAAASTLAYGGTQSLRPMLENMPHHRVFAVDDAGHELLGRIVNPTMLNEAQTMINKGDQRVVRHVTSPDGHRYMLFLPSRERQRGLESESRMLLAGAGMPGMEMPGYRRDRRPPPGFDGPPPPQGASSQPSAPPAMAPGDASAATSAPAAEVLTAGSTASAAAHGRAGAANPAYASASSPVAEPPPGGPGVGPGMGRGPGPGIGPGPVPGMPGGPEGRPRFQPLAPYVPVVAAVLASLLFAALLAWYFSRPIRSLRDAFEAASQGDLAPRFANTSKRGDELNALGHDFDRMTARLRSLIDGQTRLLHDVSHELRSPLARLQAAIGLAHQQPDKMRATLERIERESIRMDKLVGELLTLSRLEAGAITTQREEISMADLLDGIVGDAEFEAATHGRAVVQHGDADGHIVGQPDLLARAIENVVRNAIKHSPVGGTVDVEMARDEAQRQLRIRVLDRGPGVQKEDLKAIFQPFYRSSTTQKDVEGHGLGLAIAQQVVQQHGGSINAANREDGGLCVEIALPLS